MLPVQCRIRIVQAKPIIGEPESAGIGVDPRPFAPHDTAAALPPPGTARPHAAAGFESNSTLLALRPLQLP
jgi:hypothetical protein